jgi:hypothetical protein
VPLAARGAGLVDQLHRRLDEPLCQLLRVADGRGRGDEDRVAAVVRADALEPADHVGHVAAEHPAVGVQLVDHHVAQVLEEVRPLGVVRQDAPVQHVRVGHHHVAAIAQDAPRLGRRVAVVGEGLEVVSQGADQLAELGHLVLRERLGGVEVEGPRPRLGAQPLEHRQVEAQRLSAGGGGDDHRVPPGQRVPDRLGLVAVELLHPAGPQRPAHAGIDPVRERREPRGLRRRLVPVRHRPLEARLPPQVVEQRRDAGTLGARTLGARTLGACTLGAGALSARTLGVHAVGAHGAALPRARRANGRASGW